MEETGSKISHPWAVWGLALLAYFISIAIAVVLAPNTFTISSELIPSSAIQVFEEEAPETATEYPTIENSRALSQQHSPRQENNLRRFHTQFAAPESVSEPPRLYIPSGGSQMTAFVNGIKLADSEPVEIFAPGFGNSWLRSDIPRWMLVPGANRLDIYVYRDDARSGIGDLYLGSSSQIKNIEAQQVRWMRALPALHLSVGTMIIIISLLGLIYARQKGAYLITGCMGCILVIQASFSPITLQPEFIDSALAFRFFMPFTIALLILLLQIYDRRIWTGLNPIKVGLYGFALTGPFISLASMVLPFSLPSPMLIATLALFTPLPLLVVGSGLNIWHDLTSHKTRLEAMSGTISQQAEELDEKSELINQTLRNKAVLEERQRFTRDIHDGIGGQLLSLLLRVRTNRVGPEEIANELQAGLDDLRLVVDSLDHTGDNLSAALTTFKARAYNQLASANINLNWEQSETLDVEFPNPRGTLHLFRFMQEAMTNMIKHSGASQALFQLMQDGPQSPLKIFIADNGTGMDTSEKSAGRGIGNLKSRAVQLGGSLEFGEGIETKGTGISLTLPHRPVQALID